MSVLKESLARGPVDIKFIKADGTQREMLATTNQSLFTYNYKGGDTRETHGVIRVWDIIKSDWRSIREDRIVSWRAG